MPPRGFSDLSPRPPATPPDLRSDTVSSLRRISGHSRLTVMCSGSCFHSHGTRLPCPNRFWFQLGVFTKDPFLTQLPISSLVRCVYGLTSRTRLPWSLSSPDTRPSPAPSRSTTFWVDPGISPSDLPLYPPTPSTTSVSGPSLPTTNSAPTPSKQGF